MRKPEQAAEPSIEEILASIRRIIADDAPAAVLADHDEGASMRPHSTSGAPGPKSGETGLRAREGRHGEDEVLELTEDFMLAEEAPAMVLREPGEPAETSANGQYGDPFAERSSDDPYDEAPIGRKPQKPQSSPEVLAATLDGERGSNGGNGLASVMAEVQRFVDIGKAAGAPDPGPRPLENKSLDSKPLDNWTQPQNEVFKTEPVPRPAARWSARQGAAEPPKNAEPAASRAAPAARDHVQPQKPGFSNRDSWSQGMQMPVPEDGPAIPFAEEGLELPQPSVKPSPTARAAAAPEEAQAPGEPPRQASSDLPMEPAMEAEATLSGGAQTRAEKMAERAVADFASDKLASAAPVADFLKADRPLMEEITGTLATALAKIEEVNEAIDEAAPPPIEEVGEENAAPEFPVHATFAESLKPELPPAPELPRLDIGFMASSPVLPSGPVAATEQDVPELPREEGDEIAAAPHRERAETVSARPRGGFAATGGGEPAAMTQMPSAPVHVMPRSMTGTPSHGAVRESDLGRLQPAASAPKTLEDTVREMLRPLLVQWLNENMPRILSDALREEIAAATMLPHRRDDERR